MLIDFASKNVTRSVLACALGGVALTAVAAQAQSGPGSFQLPDPTPTPTPAPQGPVDERAGVPIAPRVIPEARTTPAPTPTPTPTTASPPATSAAEPPETNVTSPAVEEPSRTTTAQTPPLQPVADTARSAPPAARSSVPAEVPQPGTGLDTAPGLDTETAIGPNDWYDVDPSGAEQDAAIAGPSIGDDLPQSADTGSWGGAESFLTRTQNLAFAGVMTILLLGFAIVVWRRRRAAAEPLALPAPALAAGVRKSIAATRPEGAPEEPAPAPAPAPAPPAAPLDVDIALEIVSASRSVMMFMLDYRITIANRSEAAARDIEIGAQLTCAQRGATNAPPIAGGQPVGTIERIGPHQSRSVTGQLQIPLTEVQAIRQGQKPIFIPLLHLSLVSAGDHVVKRSFVVGAPSTVSQSRVHPIALDTPPGGIPGLLAREVHLETA